jgi:hypothetical protein
LRIAVWTGVTRDTKPHRLARHCLQPYLAHGIAIAMNTMNVSKPWLNRLSLTARYV